MPPILELIAEHEAAMNAAAEHLREQIAKLTDAAVHVRPQPRRPGNVLA